LQFCWVGEEVESEKRDRRLCRIWRKPQTPASAQSSFAARFRVWLFVPLSTTALRVFVPFLQLPVVSQPEVSLHARAPPLLAHFCVRSPPHTVAARPAVSLLALRPRLSSLSPQPVGPRPFDSRHRHSRGR